MRVPPCVVVMLLTCVIPVGQASADIRAGVTERVSVSTDGVGANNVSTAVNVSDDGRFVVFLSHASNLVAGDTNRASDVFLRDLWRGTTERVSVTDAGQQIERESFNGSVSGDGRFVLFASSANEVVPGDDDGLGDTFLRDRLLGTTNLVSVAADGRQITSDGAIPQEGRRALSADGRYSVFVTPAADVVPGVTAPGLRGTDRRGNHAYVRDHVAGTTVLATASADGTPGTLSTQNPTISADGRHVAFETQSPLIPGNGDTDDIDVYVKDLDTGTVTQAGVHDDGTQANDGTWRPQLSADGGVVAFDSFATTLVTRDAGTLVSDVFVRDRRAGRTTKVSVDAAGLPPRVEAYRPAISGDGRLVAFWSSDPLAAESGGVGGVAVYVHDRETGSTELVSVAADGARGNGSDQLAQMSGDGSTIAWLSGSSNLVPGDDNGKQDVYVRRRGPVVGVAGDLDAEVADGRVVVTGLARFGGSLLASASDPRNDVRPHAAATAAVGDLVSAQLAIRHEERDQLFARLVAAPLVDVYEVPGAPATVFGLALTVDGVPYELRMAGGEPAREPEAQLWACAVACVLQEVVRGSYGTAGSEIRFALPLSSVRARAGSGISGVRGFASAGTVAAHVPLDEVPLPDAVVPATGVRLGVEDRLVAVPSPGGVFGGEVDLAGLRPGAHDVIARVCAGATCGDARVPVTIERDATAMDLALEPAGPVVALRATLTRRGGAPVPGAQITLRSTRALGTATTTATGVATLSVRRAELKRGDVVTATFEATDDLVGTQASATFTP